MEHHITIDSGRSHKECWFSVAILNYQRALVMPVIATT